MPSRFAVAAVCFDLGETLYHYGEGPLSWLELSRPGLEAVARACGIGEEDADLDAAEATVVALGERSRGGIEEANLQDAMAAALHALGGDLARHVETAVDAFFDTVRESLEPYPDAVGTLAELKRRRFKVGVLTNVPYGTPHRTIQEDLERTGLAPHIDAVVTSADVGLRKPEPAPYEWLAGMLTIAPADMVYAGNADTDVRGALAVGAVPVLIDRAGEPSEYGQAATVTTLREILDLVELK